MSRRCRIFKILLPLLLLSVFARALPVWGRNAMTEKEKSDLVQKLYENYKKDFPTVEDISPVAAQALAARVGVIFIDVRTPEEQSVSMLPGAVTEEAVSKNPSLLQGKTAVAYCTIGYRSGLYAEKMAKQGIRVLNLSGGILAWVFSGGKVYHDGRETKRVHVYGEKWDYLPDGYEPVMFGFFQRF
jgi:sodium/bile acid cotransporter 7